MPFLALGRASIGPERPRAGPAALVSAPADRRAAMHYDAPMPESPGASRRPPRRLAETVFRTGLVAVSLALALAAIDSCGRWEIGQERLADLAGGGAPLPAALAAEIRREPDLERARVVAARAVLGAELEPSHPAALAGSRDAGPSRLAGAAAEAAAALAARPSAWDAAMVLGAATYLEWSESRDPRLFQRYAAWEAPLRAALDLAPSRREPARFLAAAYLEVWPAMTAEKRAAARRTIATALADPDAFGGLLVPWLQAAGSRDEAFSLVPDEPEAWRRVAAVFAERRDWEGEGAARRRLARAVERRLRGDLAAAEELLARGDDAGARERFLAVAAAAAPGVGRENLLGRALDECPPGVADAATAAKLSGQLAWVLDRCQIGGCPLEPQALRRLARFCRDLPPPEAALAAVLGGELARAEQLERHAEPEESAAWAPYFVEKGRSLAAAGRTADAVAALDRVDAGLRGAAYWRARREVAQAMGDPAVLGEAEAHLRQLAATSWPATAWSWRGSVARLSLLTAADAAGLRVEIAEAPPGGALVEARLDDAVLGSTPALPGGALTLAASIPAGLHRLEVESIGGGAVTPGAVALAVPRVGAGAAPHPR